MRRAMRLRAMVSFAGEDDELIPPQDELRAWFRAEDLAQADGTTVSTWQDRTANANHLAQVVGVPVPTYVASAASLKGRGAVQFSGTQQLYKASPANIPHADRPCSIYVVCDPDFAGGLGTTLPIVSLGTDGVTLGRPTLLYYNTGAQWIVAVDSYATNSPSFNATDAAQIGAFYIDESEAIASSEILVNGVLPTPFGAGVGGALAVPYPVSELRIGGFVANNTPSFVGKIAEILIYGKNHGAPEREATIAYLASRYGIAV